MKKPEWVKATIQSRKRFSYSPSKPASAQPYQSIGYLITRMFDCWSCGSKCICSLDMVSTAWSFIGSAFFGYFILIIHEASHNMLFLSSNGTTRKNINRKIGTMARVPFFTEYIRHWQEGHVTHHVRPCEHDDPQNPDPLR